MGSLGDVTMGIGEPPTPATAYVVTLPLIAAASSASALLGVCTRPPQARKRTGDGYACTASLRSHEHGGPS
jgi:hypothetical protein